MAPRPPPSAQASRSTLGSSVKHTLPDPFKGIRSQKAADEFLTGLETHFLAAGMNDDNEKIILATTLLRGKASQWIRRYMSELSLPREQRTQDFLKTWTSFRKQFLILYGDVDPMSTAYREFHEIKQTGSVAEFADRYITTLEYLENEMANLRYQGFLYRLKPRVQESLTSRGDDLPGVHEFERLVKTAILVDERIHSNRSHQSPRTVGTSSTPRNTAKPSSTNDGPAPMDVDVNGVDSRPSGSKDDRRIKAEEREFRKTNNLCFFCGGKHKLAECPKKSNRFRKHNSEGEAPSN